MYFLVECVFLSRFNITSTIIGYTVFVPIKSDTKIKGENLIN